MLQLMGHRQAEDQGYMVFCVFAVLKKEGHAAVCPCGPLKLHILAETVLWQAVFASVYHDPVARQPPTTGKRSGEQRSQKRGSRCQMYSFPLRSFKETSCAPALSITAVNSEFLIVVNINLPHFCKLIRILYHIFLLAGNRNIESMIVMWGVL